MDTARPRARVNGTSPRVKPPRGTSRPPRRAEHAIARSRPAGFPAPIEGAKPDRTRDRELLAIQILRARHRAT
jgi:hypothetical protein